MCCFFSSLLLATVYRQLRRMSYMDVAGRENIHVTINDAVMHALKAVRNDFYFHFITYFSIISYSQRATRDSVVYLPGLPMPYVGIENVAYTPHENDDDDDDENGDKIMKSYL